MIETDHVPNMIANFKWIIKIFEKTMIKPLKLNDISSCLYQTPYTKFNINSLTLQNFKSKPQ